MHSMILVIFITHWEEAWIIFKHLAKLNLTKGVVNYRSSKIKKKLNSVLFSLVPFKISDTPID